MDNKTKKQRYFDKLKADPVRLAAYHEKERQRVNNLRRKQREELKGRPDLQKKLREQETLRKRKQREKKKEGLSDPSTIQNSELGSFKRPQSLGKAVNKLKKNLPKSPSKKQAVIRKLINEFPELLHSSKKSLFRKKVLSDEDRQIVVNFYCREDISYQAPGKRDTKSVKDPETKKRKLLQKRYLIMSVKELYQQFIEETNLRHVKKTAFYNLRPKHVLLVSDIPHTVSVCKFHANFNYLLESLKNNGVTETDFTPNGSDVISRAVCSLKNEKCMLSSCIKCKDVDIEQVLVAKDTKDYDPEKKIKWKRWVDIEKRPKITECYGTVSELILEIKKQLPAFKVHCFVKRVQADESDTRRKKGLPSFGVLQIDFAENFSIISQDEIQSAHWSHEQVTLFTGCAWIGDTTTSYTVVSDDLSHGKLSIKVFLYKIVEDLKKRFQRLEKLSIFSDGPSSQFKNKFTAYLLCSLQNDFSMDVEWLFFATSHGKGAVDAIGGALKRSVWLTIKSRKRLVSSAYDFYECGKSVLKGTHLFYIPKEEVIRQENQMNEEWINVLKVPNIRSSHYMRPYYDSQSVLVARTVNSEMTRHDIIKQPATTKRLHYHDVYSSSEDEVDDSCTFHDGVDASYMYQDGEDASCMYSQDSNESDISKLQNFDYLNASLTNGSFIEVEITSEKGLKHNYFAIFKEKVECEELVVTVEFLKQCTKKDKLFTLDEKSASFKSNISIKQIVRILDQPDIVTKGERIYYKFV